MPTFLSDPSPAFTFILGLVALVAFGIWFKYRDKTSRNRMIAVTGVVGIVIAVGIVFDSPREEATARVNDLVAAANARDPAKFLTSISDSFDYKGMKKEDLRTMAGWGLMKQYDVRVAAWSFSRDDAVYSDDKKSVEIGFLAKAESQTDKVPLAKTVKAKFVKDADGKYRLAGMKFFDYVKGANGPEETIPGLSK